ncbi:hypothetical protein ASE67_02710 [Sphingomonas sp. Leaf23]|uniref:glycosyl hydrolase 108 family protein n=1 Tax=Sphingomonas sp. Leaf23 TaxID=1735689 RepID=UPI000700D2B3|nr:glycosyl hydrolase 108 family protein [Sphingomonas sp. Leaf23]KQM88671.1 hypothetical protein ASE67_02710 [Sphingomonas sp. Leaf23]
MMTPHDFAKDFITRWEGKLSLDPIDNGNWTGGKQGVGALVGSNYGVTAAALAAHRKVPVATITKPVMAALTLDEAADIALAQYYRKPRLDLLPWNRVTASIFDMGWGTGPSQAIKLLQRMVGTADDGINGPATAAAYKAMLDRFGEAFVSALWWSRRYDFYDAIIKSRPANAKYERGWKNRSDYFTPGGDGWWSRFAA